MSNDVDDDERVALDAALDAALDELEDDNGSVVEDRDEKKDAETSPPSSSPSSSSAAAASATAATRSEKTTTTTTTKQQRQRQDERPFLGPPRPPQPTQAQPTGDDSGATDATNDASTPSFLKLMEEMMLTEHRDAANSEDLVSKVVDRLRMQQQKQSQQQRQQQQQSPSAKKNRDDDANGAAIRPSAGAQEGTAAASTRPSSANNNGNGKANNSKNNGKTSNNNNSEEVNDAIANMIREMAAANANDGNDDSFENGNGDGGINDSLMPELPEGTTERDLLELLVRGLEEAMNVGGDDDEDDDEDDKEEADGSGGKSGAGGDDDDDDDDDDDVFNADSVIDGMMEQLLCKVTRTEKRKLCFSLCLFALCLFVFRRRRRRWFLNIYLFVFAFLPPLPCLRFSIGSFVFCFYSPALLYVHSFVIIYTYRISCTNR